MFSKSQNMDQAIAVVVVVVVVHGGCLLTDNDSLFHTYTNLFMHACMYVCTYVCIACCRLHTYTI